MKHATITAVLFLLAITQGSAEFQCPLATFVELGKGVVIDCLISDVNDIYWLRGTEEDHYPIVKIEMGRKTISKVAQDHFDITDTGALVIRDASNDLTGSYVMLHYRTDLVREVDTVTLNVTTLVDSIIIQGPSGGVYPMGSNITLTCTFQKGYVVGWKEYKNKDIFVADTKVTADTKYDNFRVSLSDRISNLQIIGAELEDAGKYSCNTESYAHVEIEAPPTLRIICNVTDDEDTYSPESHDVIDITCTARNAKPAVMIRFKTDGNEWINPSETWTVSKGVTFDTSATLKYNVRKNQNDGFLTCQAFGQKTVPPMEKTIHLFTPTCDLHLNTIEASCNCTANPPVYKYIISIDGKLEVGKTISVENLGGSNISCTGVNYIGVGISTSRVVESISAQPSLRIMFNVTDGEGNNSTESHGVIDITCIARNARPAVMIRFETDGGEWINPSETWTVSNGVTFDTSATLKYSFVKKQTDVFLTCQTFGQRTVPPMEKTIHLFIPNCSLDMSNTEATCSCTSNPPVYKYIISIDGKQEVGKTLNVENLGGSNISCTGVNYIGEGISTPRVVESINDSSFPVNVVIIVVVILVAVIAFVMVYRWRKKHNSQANSKDTEHSESALPEENHLLSDPNEKSEQNTKDLPEKCDGSPCADRKPMENSNVVAPDKEKLLVKNSPAEPERAQIPGNKGTPAEPERCQIPGNKASNPENNEKGSSDKSRSSPSGHNHGRLKSTAKENLNAQRDNQHSVAGTTTASENKKQRHAGCAVTGNKNQSQASPGKNAVQSTQRGSKEASNRAKNKEENKKDLYIDELERKFRERSKHHQEAVYKSPQHNTGQETKEDIGETSRQRLVEKRKSMFESPKQQPDSACTQQGGRK